MPERDEDPEMMIRRPPPPPSQFIVVGARIPFVRPVGYAQALENDMSLKLIDAEGQVKHFENWLQIVAAKHPLRFGAVTAVIGLIVGLIFG